MIEIVFYLAFAWLANNTVIAGTWGTIEECIMAVEEAASDPDVLAVSDCEEYAIEKGYGKK